MTLGDLIDAPLEFVVVSEGVALSRDGDKLIGICPFHDDDDPSFAVWNYGGRDFCGCWACGFGPTDAIGFLREKRGVDYPTALVYANRYSREALGLNWQSTALPVREKQVQAHDFTEELKQSRQGMPEAAKHFLMNRGLSVTDAQWVIDEFQLGGDEKYIVVPHLTPSGRHVTAIKYRVGGAKLMTMDDGTLAFLYGCWRDTGQPYVLLCEGESDTWRVAAFWRHDPRVLVLGLPSGAKGPRDSWLLAIGGRRLGVLFDADEAGYRATTAWLEARDGTADLTAKLQSGLDASKLDDHKMCELFGLTSRPEPDMVSESPTEGDPR